MATLVAMLAANSPASEFYFHILDLKVLGLTIQHWINDGLMAIFFFLIGMEIKREIVDGELASFRQAALPVFAALGGMILPATIYLIFNSSSVMAKGWAIPMATDIAFALGVLTLLGKRVPLSLKIFLLTLAIVDDLGAIIVIATFYTEEIRSLGLWLAFAGIVGVIGARSLGLKSYFFYLPLGLILWLGIFYSGIHATIAGVILGFLTPASFANERKSGATFSPLDNLIHMLHPWVSFGIMPIFALTNAGIPFAGVTPSSLLADSVSIGVIIGLLLGKPVGVLLFSYFSVFLGLAKFPRGLRWQDLVGISCLSGIGFTMAIFITNISLPEGHAKYAKIGVLVASGLSAILGYCLLAASLARVQKSRAEPHAAQIMEKF